MFGSACRIAVRRTATSQAATMPRSRASVLRVAGGMSVSPISVSRRLFSDRSKTATVGGVAVQLKSGEKLLNQSGSSSGIKKKGPVRIADDEEELEFDQPVIQMIVEELAGQKINDTRTVQQIEKDYELITRYEAEQKRLRLARRDADRARAKAAADALASLPAEYRAAATANDLNPSGPYVFMPRSWLALRKRQATTTSLLPPEPATAAAAAATPTAAGATAAPKPAAATAGAKPAATAAAKPVAAAGAAKAGAKPAAAAAGGKADAKPAAAAKDAAPKKAK